MQPSGCIVVVVVFIVAGVVVMRLMFIAVLAAIVLVVGAIDLPAVLLSVFFGSTDILRPKIFVTFQCRLVSRSEVCEASASRFELSCLRTLSQTIGMHGII